MKRSVCASVVALCVVSALGVVAAATEASDGTVIVRARFGAAPIPSADVGVDEQRARTDARGEARLVLPPGEHSLTVSHAGFAPLTLPVTVPAAGEITVTFQLQEQRIETEVVVVTATRSGKIIEDQPIRVEAVPQEEIEENLTIAPGNLTTLLNEIGGVRVQTTSPGLGGANPRMQGLSGRYTHILLDELPLYGEQPDDFSLLQTPPLGLAQVEVIKGTASALYGGSALGGLLNLVSQRPGGEPELLLNQTSRGGTDAVGLLTGMIRDGWGYTVLGGGHRQREEDVDGDGWADLPGYWRGELRPRFFWNDDAGGSLLLTVGASVEDRNGGTIDGATTPAATPFQESLGSRRFDEGLVGRFLVANDRVVTVRVAATGTWHDRWFGESRERDARALAMAEATLSGYDRGHTWVVGAAFQGDWYRSRDLPGFDFTHRTPAVLAQDDYSVTRLFGVSASARLDFDSGHHTLFSPLVSALLRPAAGWTMRLSAGTGYSLPTPFVDETQVVGLSRVVPLEDVQPERAKSASFDVGWSTRHVELNGTLFASEVRDALMFRDATAQPGRFEIVNAQEPTDTVGAELLGRFTVGPLHMITTYTYLHATEADPAGGLRREVALTPRHAGELACIWESEAKGRVGFEVSYTGPQHLEHDPYRDVSASYVEVNALGELRIREVRLFLNAVNLTNVHQTHFDPLLLPAQAPDGRWTTDVWAPLDGRVVNVGVRVEF